ncbi:MAG: D-alanyl-D-alanine carboxypeptidase [Defluviitaleaceae bacterium]|nr:D-alanyl-D-alanine carboxypeptidase [Defluviitaleaceae bacterium]
MRKIALAFIFFLISLFSSVAVFAEYDETEATAIPVQATAAILVEQTTGRVLFGYNYHEQRYPASMTKMLTALVVLDHLAPDDIIAVGPEIHNMPSGYASLAHVEGEYLTVRMLLKALMIRSGNETGRVLALNVIRQTQNNPYISYEDAKREFSILLNQRAQELGAENTNFNNPYGLHSPHHFTTAYDLALIARAYMEVPLLAEIAGMRTFNGYGTEGRYIPDAYIRHYSWTNTNQMLPDAPFGHPNMTGIKTGFTTPAGECLAGAATLGDLSLITIVFDSESPGRWQDTHRLMNYGFLNYAFREVARAGELVEYVRINNPRRGGTDILAVHAYDSHTALLSHAEYASLTRVITYHVLFRPPPVRRDDDYEYEDYYDDGLTRLQAPIEEGEVIGRVAYYIGDTLVFEGNLLAAATVYERTFDSDMDYFISRFTDNIFTLRGLPYWLAVGGTIIGFSGMGWALSLRRKLKEHDRWHKPRPRGGKRT